MFAGLDVHKETIDGRSLMANTKARSAPTRDCERPRAARQGRACVARAAGRCMSCTKPARVDWGSIALTRAFQMGSSSQASSCPAARRRLSALSLSVLATHLCVAIPNVATFFASSGTAALTNTSRIAGGSPTTSGSLRPPHTDAKLAAPDARCELLRDGQLLTIRRTHHLGPLVVTFWAPESPHRGVGEFSAAGHHIGRDRGATLGTRLNEVRTDHTRPLTIFRRTYRCSILLRRAFHLAGDPKRHTGSSVRRTSVAQGSGWVCKGGAVL
jgi:hypothetical protein